MKTCPVCSSPVDIKCDFGNLNEEVKCPGCDAILEVSYDAIWDGEDEHGWFYLELKDAA